MEDHALEVPGGPPPAALGARQNRWRKATAAEPREPDNPPTQRATLVRELGDELLRLGREGQTAGPRLAKSLTAVADADPELVAPACLLAILFQSRVPTGLPASNPAQGTENIEAVITGLREFLARHPQSKLIPGEVITELEAHVARETDLELQDALRRFYVGVHCHADLFGPPSREDAFAAAERVNQLAPRDLALLERLTWPGLPFDFSILTRILYNTPMSRRWSQPRPAWVAASLASSYVLELRQRIGRLVGEKQRRFVRRVLVAGAAVALSIALAMGVMAASGGRARPEDGAVGRKPGGPFSAEPLSGSGAPQIAPEPLTPEPVLSAIPVPSGRVMALIDPGGLTGARAVEFSIAGPELILGQRIVKEIGEVDAVPAAPAPQKGDAPKEPASAPSPAATAAAPLPSSARDLTATKVLRLEDVPRLNMIPSCRFCDRRADGGLLATCGELERGNRG